MHHSKWLALLLAVSLFMGSTVGTSAMAAQTLEDMASGAHDKDIKYVLTQDQCHEE